MKVIRLFNKILTHKLHIGNKSFRIQKIHHTKEFLLVDLVKDVQLHYIMV
jgi:hypothetical protein